MVLLFFFFKQKTAYEMRISDWSSDVCSSDLPGGRGDRPRRNRREQPLTPQVATAGGSMNAGAKVLTIRPGTPFLDALAAGILHEAGDDPLARSEERRVGKECGSTCRSRWSREI